MQKGFHLRYFERSIARVPPETEHQDTLDHDIRLLRKIGEGDQESLGRFYDCYGKLLFSVAFRVLNDSQNAEDVVQEVFLKIWEKAPIYDASRGKPLTWAVTMTRNKAIDRLRSLQRQARLVETIAGDAETEDQFDDTDALGSVLRTESAARLREAMAELTDQHREVLELTYFAFLSQSEIAERLGVPVGTIKARVRRAMSSLRTIIQRDETGWH